MAAVFKGRMSCSFYTIDDLRLGCQGKNAPGWQLSQFSTWQEALEHYNALPKSGIKELGATTGVQILTLVRRLPLQPEAQDGEDVLMANALTLTVWRGIPVQEAVQALIQQLRIRYCLDDEQVIPMPAPEAPPYLLDDTYLWLNQDDEAASAIQWVNVAGIGWVTPAELRRRYPAPGQDFRYPLVTLYRVDGMTESGAFSPLEVTPWQYQHLVRRTHMRLDQIRTRRNT